MSIASGPLRWSAPIFFLLFLLLGLPVQAEELLIPDISPWSHREADGSLTGPAALIAQKLIERSGLPLQLQAMPARRIVAYLQEHGSSFALGFPGGDLPSGIIQIGNPARVPWVAIGRREDGPLTAERFASLQKVGVSRGAVVLFRDLPSLRERPIIEVENVEAGLKMVAAKRLDAYLGRQVTIEAYLSKSEDRDLFGDSLFCSEGNSYLVTGTAFKDSPAAQTLTATWNAMILDGSLRQLLKDSFSSAR